MFDFCEFSVYLAQVCRVLTLSSPVRTRLQLDHIVYVHLACINFRVLFSYAHIALLPFSSGKLGSGTFAEVSKAVTLEGGEFVAIKGTYFVLALAGGSGI